MSDTARSRTAVGLLAGLLVVFLGWAGPPDHLFAQTANDPASQCQRIGTRDDLEHIDASDPMFRRLAKSTDQNARSLAWRCASGRALTCPAWATADCMKPNLSRTPDPATAAYCRRNPNSGSVPGSDSDRTSVYAWRCAGRTAVPERQVTWPGPLDARGFAIKDWTLVPAASAPPGGSIPAGQAPRPAASYVLPVPISGRVWGYFDPEYLRDEDRQHLGLDLPAAADAVVVSPVDGTVITDRTGAADIMQAYMVIREDHTGVEHVLGHVTSTVSLGHVDRGDPVATVRDWGARSHVHWGANRLGVAQALTDKKWGWGRAPAGATREKAAARGWLDLTPRLSGAPRPAASVARAPPPSAAPAGDPAVPPSVRAALNVRYPGWALETRAGRCDPAWRGNLFTADFNRDGAVDHLIKLRRGRNIYIVALIARGQEFAIHELKVNGPDDDDIGVQVLRRGGRYFDYEAQRQRTIDSDSPHIGYCEMSAWLMVYRNGSFAQVSTGD